ncbi:hypothetical protein AL013_03705 [Mariprofundus ferrooxydans]|uniref:DNA polymerase III subunit delta n=1 Tax=Mariprofundus ferrooxydans PV-1 TaxID=314345 RepID=Q0F3S3_9PROT|nr:hypothetical protein [Mariprofundus ferrooxydans]EAU55868.1 DNA polymerase III subunit delta [Mariprofundus ferrooxydans PV-1]KON48150.1 hypothetical protein AL013_03705 [Mariprofundus ferrooxydans]
MLNSVTGLGDMITSKVKLLCCFLVLIYAMTGTALASPGSGAFVYSSDAGNELVYYQVRLIDFHGVAAREVVWECGSMQARHVLQQSDGKPLYALRKDLQKHEEVEVIYGLHRGEPTLYRRHAGTGVVERRIDQDGLLDLGGLPAMLIPALAGRDVFRFSALNYADGKVYDFRAMPTGYRQVATAAGRVRCALIEVKLDSWLSALTPSVQLVLPLSQAGLPFIAYSGPALAGSGSISLRLVGASPSLAMLETR